MKATGIVRRIDDLGRVVIPKEIRRTFRIREGDLLEIYTADGGYVMFKKYNETPDRTVTANNWLKANKDFLDVRFARFSIDGDEITCEGVSNNRRVVGKSKRNPSDEYSPSIGMVYAASRAFNLRLPEDWT